MQAAIGGPCGLLLAVGAWIASIPVLTWVLVVIGGFLAMMAAATLVSFVGQAWRAWR